MQGPETITLMDVTGPCISTVLMLISTYTVNVSAVNYFTAHQKHVRAGL